MHDRSEMTISAIAGLPLFEPGMDEAALLGCIDRVAPAFEIVFSPFSDWNIRAADATKDEAGPVVFASVNMSCSATDPIRGGNGNINAQVVTIFNAGPNNNSTFVFSLTGGFINGANETSRAAVNPQTYDAGFDVTRRPGHGKKRHMSAGILR